MAIVENLKEALNDPERVTGIDIVGNDLRYEDITIPKEIAKCKHLQLLKLSIFDQIDLPEELKGIKSLQELEISEFFNKELPEVIYELTQLKSLTIDGHTYLKKIKSDIKNLKELTTLKITYGALESLPKEVGTLSKLKVLDLTCCELDGLPESLADLHLEELHIGRNKFSILPPILFKLTSLKVLGIHQADKKFFKDRYEYNISSKDLERLKEALPHTTFKVKE